MTAKEFMKEPVEETKTMTAKEFMKEPVEETKTMTAKEFMKEPEKPKLPVIIEDNKPVPKEEINNIKAVQFLAPSEPTPAIPIINIPKPQPIQQIQRPPSKPMTANQFLNAPPKSIEPLNIKSIIEPTIEIKSSKKSHRKKKYYTPADFGFYKFRRGGAEASVDDAIVVEQTADPRVFVNPYSNETASIENTGVPRNADGTEFDPNCYAKNYPDMAKALDGDLEKISKWWSDKGHEAGDDATCGTFILDPNLRVQMINDMKARETVCGTAGLYWDSKTQKCDESRNADGSKNVELQKCKRRNGYYSNRKCDLMRNQDGDFDANVMTSGKFKACSARGDFTTDVQYWDKSTRNISICDSARNIDGTIKTKSDACTTSNNYWDVDEERCDSTRDAYGDLKTDKEVCEFGGNFWDGSTCDVTRSVQGMIKVPQEVCNVNKRGTWDGECRNESKEYPSSLSKMDEYVNATYGQADSQNKVISDLKLAKAATAKALVDKHKLLLNMYNTAISDFMNLQKYVFNNKKYKSESYYRVLNSIDGKFYPKCNGFGDDGFKNIEEVIEYAIKAQEKYYIEQTLPWYIKQLDPQFLESFNLPVDELDVLLFDPKILEKLQADVQKNRLGAEFYTSEPYIEAGSGFSSEYGPRGYQYNQETTGIRYTGIGVEIVSAEAYSSKYYNTQPRVKFMLLGKRKKVTVADFKEYIDERAEKCK